MLDDHIMDKSWIISKKYLAIEGGGKAMKYRALAWTAGALASAVGIGTLFVYSFNMNHQTQQQAQKNLQGIVQEETEDYAYILRSENGRLAVFVKGNDEAQMVFDAAVRQLPEYDQRQLEQGIYVRDYETLVRLIEDYIS